MPAANPVPRAPDPAEVAALHALILRSLEDDQAVDTVSIPLAGKSSIADHMVVTSGRSTRQVASMAGKLAERIKAEFGRSVRIEGMAAADWVLIDAGDVIVHVFRPEVRSFYNLEKMWAFGDAPAAPGGGTRTVDALAADREAASDDVSTAATASDASSGDDAPATGTSDAVPDGPAPAGRSAG